MKEFAMKFNFTTWKNVLVEMINNKISRFEDNEFEYMLNYNTKTFMISKQDVMSITFKNQKFININQQNIVDMLIKL
jgi:hypothetical protein